ncbi:hypothetical protein IWW51_002207 [Coemansia sp. RSA 2702]|nr:hypothetical protein IWW54_001325 [Coemansia sp. RSA 2705]KAJ2320842.1 hypothetical protein IWW52_001112 [Coemansia sp. RSA 2704]KAJ2326568.1 hypothetical protein IWW51_002207 [Coemansia sp. RSA 2702]KAJ2370088.1 hypothetical protein H4S01_000599 [Coemansia sp. RSA 2610]
MQNRFAAKPPRPESPNNSDSRSYSSSEYTSSQSSDEEELRKTSKQPLPAESKTPERQSDAELSEPEIGPMPAQSQQPLLSARSFGKALLPGEGMAMAAFVQSGERIPRRGEIGMDQDRIDRLEGAGYVMSGNRHGRMNAVRLRKEGQVITAEEKRQMLLQNQEERQAKESQIIAEFREMLAKKK